MMTGATIFAALCPQPIAWGGGGWVDVQHLLRKNQVFLLIFHPCFGLLQPGELLCVSRQ